MTALRQGLETVTGLVDAAFLGNSVERWAIAAGTTVAILAALLLARWVLSVRLGRIAARTTNRVDDLVVALIRRTRTFFLAAVSLVPGAQVLTLPAEARQGIHMLVVVAGVIQAAIWGNVLIKHLLESRVESLRQDDPSSATTLNGVTVLARLVLWSILVLLALDNLGVNISTLVAGLGIGGVAIALATQNILGDLFASLSIVLDKPFVVGDFIIVGDLMGTVEHVGLKTTRLKSLWGEQLVFANADLLSSRIRNYKRMQERRVVFGVGVIYQTTQAQLQAIPGMIREIIEADPLVRFDRAHFKSFDDSALSFEVVYYVLDPDYNRYMDVQQRINLAIFARFAREGIEFAYPTRTLYMMSPQPAAAAG